MKKIKKIVLGVVLAFSLTGVGFILGNIEDSVKVTDNSNSTEFDLKLPGEVEKRTVTKSEVVSRIREIGELSTYCGNSKEKVTVQHMHSNGRNIMNRKSQKEIQVTTHMVRQFLQENEDTGYRDFHSNLLPGVDNVMGIRLPVLRKFAKQLSGMDWQEWFEQADDQWYEETMLRGLVSAYAKMECKERLTYVAKFVPDINNWAVCDCFCSTLKDADKYQTEYWDFIETYFTSNKEYEARFAAVMLLGHFVKREYLKESIRRLESITQQGYYAKMAVAWAVSVYFAAFPDEMLTYLQDGHKLDEFTYKKSLQKITESYRVDKEMKKIIKEMRQRG